MNTNRTVLSQEEKDYLNKLSTKVNRSRGQQTELFNLLERDREKLERLEVQLKNCFVTRVPESKEEVERVMSLEVKSTWFSLN